MPNTLHRVGNGPHPVLVLHGWFGDARAFEPIEAWLSQDKFSYVFMDYRGYGGMKEANDEFTIDEIAAVTLALADALGFPRFSLIGHSMYPLATVEVLENPGHYPMNETPLALVTALERFLLDGTH